ncbi:RNA polymerase sigma factor [Gephyromycinifex aptenodytis]|uniref:hypothetical protein n=1 Tax=Gephyromycinifex aptenodytis TaxID=2716227 RepID=UPI001446294C|nr:hypothetical protein [Gephyromycinifex aptenodytis]
MPRNTRHDDPTNAAQTVHHGRWTWQDDDGNPWVVTPTFGAVDGRWEVVGLEVRSCRLEDEDVYEGVLPPRRGRLDDPTAPQPVPLTARSWRAMSGLIKETRRRHVADLAEHEFFGQARGRDRWAERRDRSQAALEAVALVYRDHLAKGGTEPRQAVAAAFNIAPSTAGQRIYRARKAGLIAETTPGRLPDSTDN